MPATIAERLQIFHDTSRWIFDNMESIRANHTGIVAVCEENVIGADTDIEKVWSLAKASGFPLERIVIMELDDPLNCSGIAIDWMTLSKQGIL